MFHWALNTFLSTVALEAGGRRKEAYAAPIFVKPG